MKTITKKYLEKEIEEMETVRAQVIAAAGASPYVNKP